jgi:hypothetical protein
MKFRRNCLVEVKITFLNWTCLLIPEIKFPKNIERRTIIFNLFQSIMLKDA